MTATASSDMQTDDALPAGWKWARLGEVCEITKGTSITKKKTIPGDIPVIAGGQKPPYYHSEYNRDGETITVSASGAYAGFVSYHDYPIFASDCSTIKPQENLLSTKFLFALLKSKQDELYGLQIGSGQPHVYPRDLVNIHIPLPPLDEQRRIARVLDECLALVARAKQAAEAQLEAAVALPGAYLRQALPAEGDDLPAGWRWARLGDNDIFSVVGGGTPKSQIDEYWNGGIHWITLVDLPAANLITEITDTNRTISEEGLRNSAARIIPANSVTVSSRATIGRIGINRIPLATNQGFKSVVIKDASRAIPEYVAFALTQLVPIMEELASGSTYKEIIKSRFEKLLIPLPPLDEQRRIASDLDARISVAGTLVSRIRAQLEAIDALPGAYLRQAFAGEI